MRERGLDARQLSFDPAAKDLSRPLPVGDSQLAARNRVRRAVRLGAPTSHLGKMSRPGAETLRVGETGALEYVAGEEQSSYGLSGRWPARLQKSGMETIVRIRQVLPGLFVLIGLFVATVAKAEVSESTATTFKVKLSQTVAAKPDKVWKSLMVVERWWSGDHTFSGSAANLRLEPRAGGCFCETLPDGGSVLHMTVVFIAPNQRLTMFGALGPLQTSGASGSLTFQITPQDEGSSLTLTYSVGGYYPGDWPLSRRGSIWFSASSSSA